MKKSTLWMEILCTLFLTLAAPILGDWNPGDPFKMHYPQLPDPNGWDVCLHQWIADDFQCTQTGPVSDIHFWISWRKDNVGELSPAMFDISIRKDAGGIPGEVLWSYSGGQVTIRSFGQGVQGWMCPAASTSVYPDHSQFYQVNLTDLTNPLTQLIDRRYWLVIQLTAQQPTTTEAGWKTSLQQFGAPSMWSADGSTWQPVNIGGTEMSNQAFVITGLPLQKELDFGDAPDPTYPTLLLSSGARHQIDRTGPWLGSTADFPDTEPDGQPEPSALGDDNSVRDDENGVLFSPMVAGQMANVTFEVSSGDGNGGFVSGWIDFNSNGSWESSEQIVAGIFSDGIHACEFLVPSSSIPGNTFARFRISRQGTAEPTGWAADGEVEDYLTAIKPQPRADLGDAPDSTNNYGTPMTAYPSVQANFPTVFQDVVGSAPYGPIHKSAASAAFLGSGVSGENEADMGPDADGLNNLDPPADTPDQDGNDDGLLSPVRMPHCRWTALQYTVSVAADGIYYVNIWADWNRDGDWNDRLDACQNRVIPEWAVRNQMLKLDVGPHTITSLPFVSWHDPNLPEELWLRITLSEQPWQESWGDGGCGPADGYRYGETEDYLLIPDTSCTECADLNCDGIVNLSDLAEFSRQWLSTCW